MIDGLILIALGINIMCLSSLRKKSKNDYEKGFSDGRSSVLNAMKECEDE